MPKKEIPRKVQRTPLLSQVSFESFFSVLNRLSADDNCLSAGGNLGPSLRTGTGSMAETTAGECHSNGNDSNLCEFEDDWPKKNLFTQGTLHGPDKLQHRRGVSPLRSSDPQGWVGIGLQDWDLILKQFYSVEKSLPWFGNNQITWAPFTLPGESATSRRRAVRRHRWNMRWWGGWWPWSGCVLLEWENSFWSFFWSVPAREHQRLVLGGRELEDSSNKHSKQVTAFQMFFPMLQTLKDIFSTLSSLKMVCIFSQANILESNRRTRQSSAG